MAVRPQMSGSNKDQPKRDPPCTSITLPSTLRCCRYSAVSTRPQWCRIQNCLHDCQSAKIVLHFLGRDHLSCLCVASIRAAVQRRSSIRLPPAPALRSISRLWGRHLEIIILDHCCSLVSSLLCSSFRGSVQRNVKRAILSCNIKHPVSALTQRGLVVPLRSCQPWRKTRTSRWGRPVNFLPCPHTLLSPTLLPPPILKAGQTLPLLHPPSSKTCLKAPLLAPGQFRLCHPPPSPAPWPLSAQPN